MQLVIPTIWKSRWLKETIEYYLGSKYIERIILIDNAINETPQEMSGILKDERVLYVPQEENIYVNQAWNIGVNAIGNSDCCLGILNDDIRISVTALEWISRYSFEGREVVGLLTHECMRIRRGEPPRIRQLGYSRQRSVGRQYPNFGAALFMMKDSYREIPRGLKIWYGDDWQLQVADKVMGLSCELLMHEQHMSVTEMKKDISFRRTLAEDKLYAKEVLGFE